MNCLLEKKAQKGTAGRNLKEKNPPRSQIPEGFPWGLSSWPRGIRNLKIGELREQAIRAAKAATKAKQAPKKTAMAAAKSPTMPAPKPKIVKPVTFSVPRIGGKC